MKKKMHYQEKAAICKEIQKTKEVKVFEKEKVKGKKLQTCAIFANRKNML